MSRTLERLRQFLTLIGLTALLVGGVGVASAVATFVDRRRKVIATFKSLGATGRMVFGIFLLQVGLMAAIGVVIGVAAGYLVPGLLDALYGDALPIRAELSVSGAALHRRRPTASSSRSCSRSGRWGAPSSSRRRCCSATRWRPSGAGRGRS